MISERWYGAITIVVLMLTTVKCSKGIFHPDIELCKTNIVGHPCSIICKVPNFKNPVSFFHPPSILVASCSDADLCKVKDNNRYRIVVKKDKNRVILIILKLNKVPYSGQWLCTYGGAPSRSAELVVYDMPKERPIIYLAADEGDSLTLICDLNAQGKDFDIKWYKNDVELNQKHSGRAKRFLKLDDNDSLKGNYMCSVSLNNGAFTKNGSYINVYTVRKRIKEPEIGHDVFYLSAEEGQSLTFNCDLDFNDKENSIYWTFNGNRLQNERITLTKNGNLNIKNVNTVDMGKYSCHLQQGANIKIGMKTSVVYNLYAVSKTKEKVRQPIYIQARQGEKVKLPCNLFTHNVRWNFNGDTVTKTKRKFVSVDKNQGSSVIVNDFEESDEGYYACFDQEEEYGNAPINIYYVVYREDNILHFGYNLIWIAAYMFNIVLGFISLHILSPSDYHKIYLSLFIEEDSVMKKRIKVLKWWILMSPIFLILKYPTHVTDNTGVYTFIFPSVAWILILPLNYYLYKTILSGQLKRQEETTPLSRPTEPSN